jgi:transcription initiation factor TFIIIB Brf1 subunit/transcription initiation factor TFIIB
MDDFDTFDSAMQAYEENTKKTENNNCKNIKCMHTETFKENDIISCVNCGEVIKKVIINEREWRYYGSQDSKRACDPSRVQIRKIESRSIHKDVETLGFSENIVNAADQLYNQVTNGSIYRGNSRKAIIFACIFHAYKLQGNHQVPEELIKLFGLDRKNGLKGLKIVNVNAPKDSPIHSTSITPIHIIRQIMLKFEATEEMIAEVSELYNKINNRSSKLNRSRPQSVAAALTYYWICSKNRQINIKDFSKKVELSELTISKNAKEIAKILGDNVLIS